MALEATYMWRGNKENTTMKLALRSAKTQGNSVAVSKRIGRTDIIATHDIRHSNS